MPRSQKVPWSPEHEAIAARAAAGEITLAEAIAATGRPWDSVRNKVQRLRREREAAAVHEGASPSIVGTTGRPPEPPEDAIQRTETPETLTLECRRSARITTLEELLDAAQVDRTVWEVERWTPNSWEVATSGPDGQPIVTRLFQIKAHLRRIPGASVIHALREGLLADIRAERAAPPAPHRPAILPADRRFLLVVSLFDAHFGKLAWGEEAGADYDLTIAAARFGAAVEDLLAYAAGFPLARIIFPIGNDLLQTDNLVGTTTAGTYVDTDSRYIKAFRVARRAVSAAIRRMAALAPVTVVVVPGNHDRQTAFHLGEVLAAEYDGAPGVTIKNDAPLRKYERFGVNLLGFTHGSEEKQADLPLIMAQEEPERWAQTTHREWLTGHLHKKKETRYTAGDSFNGVRVRVLPALCSADAWHAQHGYVGEHAAAEAFLYHFTRGYAGHFSTTVGSDAVEREAPDLAVAA